MTTVIGDRSFRLGLDRLSKKMREKVARANKRSADEIVRTAKVLIPEVSGDSRAEIRATQVEDGGQLVDFGSKSKVIEGQSGPRPYINPTLKVTRKKIGNRYRRIAREAVREAFRG